MRILFLLLALCFTEQALADNTTDTLARLEIQINQLQTQLNQTSDFIVTNTNASNIAFWVTLSVFAGMGAVQTVTQVCQGFYLPIIHWHLLRKLNRLVKLVKPNP